MVLNIATSECPIFMKYMAGLNDYIWKEKKLFLVETIAEVSVKTIAIEGRQKKGNETKGDSKPSGSKTGGSQSKDMKKKVYSGKAGLTCNHCKQTGHVADHCWDKYPHLKPK